MKLIVSLMHPGPDVIARGPGQCARGRCYVVAGCTTTVRVYVLRNEKQPGNRHR